MGNLKKIDVGKYGKFLDGGQYVVTTASTPEAHTTTLFNDEYIMEISQRIKGEGSRIQDYNQITVFEADRSFYISDEKNAYRLFQGEGKSHEVEYDLGHVTGRETFDDYSVEMTTFVPVSGKREFWKVCVTNNSEEERKVNLFCHFPFYVNGPMGGECVWDEQINCVYKYAFPYHVFYHEMEEVKDNFAYGYCLSDTPLTSYEGRGQVFRVSENPFDMPVAVRNGYCTNCPGQGKDLKATLHYALELAPGESKAFETSYTVTEADAVAGSVKNEATADGDNESEDPTDPGDDEVEVPTKEVVEKKGVFSMVFMSDTNLTADGKKADAFKEMFKWLKEHKFMGASALVSTGNAVADGKDKDAWKLLKDELDNLEREPGDLPYYSIAGRNEVNGDDLDYETYVENKLCEVKEWNEYEDGQIWYQPMFADDIMLVGIGYQKVLDPEKATDEEKEAQEKWLKYVNDVIGRYPNYTVVLLVNDFIEPDPEGKKDEGRLTAFGELLEEKVIAENKNVALVLCGNAEGTARWSKQYGKRNVNAIMFNYQNDEENGLGFFRVVSMNKDTGAIKVTTYSPVYDKKSYDEKHPEYDEFVIKNGF